MQQGDVSIFSIYLAAFADYPRLADRILTVLTSLPKVVQQDFLDDPLFTVALDNHTPGKGWKLLMAIPDSSGASSRCVVLRPKLSDCSEPFAHYVIAHEFAHAYLRNGGWNEIDDVEDAADAMAASWGFRRPANQ